jgi:hypothetical protein
VVINPNLKDQNYLFIIASIKKKTNIVKIRMKSHELHIETRHWTFPKMPWDEIICHICDNKKVEEEMYFIL